jgi:SAM-dependent methyltransferase
MFEREVKGITKSEVKIEAHKMNLRKHIPMPIKHVYALLRTSPRSYFQRRRILSSLKGNDVECNLCLWQGRKFMDDDWHEGTICPNCYSDVRHRLLAAALLHLQEFSMNELVTNKNVLHFAPEPQISAKLRSAARTYVTADFHREDVDRNLDITRMSSVDQKSFDLVVACDVLEHVNDLAALAELNRILTLNGTAILTVPQKDHADLTYEDDAIITPEGREKAFGQTDHLRIYGADFSKRVEAAGFTVRQVDSTSFRDDVVKRFILAPPKLSSHPLATNYRKIFFCRKEVKN